MVSEDSSCTSCSKRSHKRCRKGPARYIKKPGKRLRAVYPAFSIMLCIRRTRRGDHHPKRLGDSLPRVCLLALFYVRRERRRFHMGRIETHPIQSVAEITHDALGGYQHEYNRDNPEYKHTEAGKENKKLTQQHENDGADDRPSIVPIPPMITINTMETVSRCRTPRLAG